MPVVLSLNIEQLKQVVASLRDDDKLDLYNYLAEATENHRWQKFLEGKKRSSLTNQEIKEELEAVIKGLQAVLEKTRLDINFNVDTVKQTLLSLDKPV